MPESNPFVDQVGPYQAVHLPRLGLVQVTGPAELAAVRILLAHGAERDGNRRFWWMTEKRWARCKQRLAAAVDPLFHYGGLEL